MPKAALCASLASAHTCDCFCINICGVNRLKDVYINFLLRSICKGGLSR